MLSQNKNVIVNPFKNKIYRKEFVSYFLIYNPAMIKNLRIKIFTRNLKKKTF